MTVPINRHAGIGQTVYALIFNGVTRASSAATHPNDAIRLSERERIAEAVYAELLAANIEFRLGGLALLARVAAGLNTCCDLHNEHCEAPSELCCADCTEATHVGLTPHSDGSRCVLSAAAPQLSGGAS